MTVLAVKWFYARTYKRRARTRVLSEFILPKPAASDALVVITNYRHPHLAVLKRDYFTSQSPESILTMLSNREIEIENPDILKERLQSLQKANIKTISEPDFERPTGFQIISTVIENGSAVIIDPGDLILLSLL